jgi:hypothetical protein
MPSYTPQTWIDNNASYPLSAARMTVIETGLVAASKSQVDRGTSMPATPSDGDEFVYVVSSAAGTCWRLKYNSGSSSAYKWEFVGGAGIVSSSITQTFNADGTPPVLGAYQTLPRGGDYRVTSYIAVQGQLANELQVSVDLQIAGISFTQGGMQGHDYCGTPSSGAQQANVNMFSDFVATGRNGGDQVKMSVQVHTLSAGQQVFVASSRVTIIPVRVS